MVPHNTGGGGINSRLVVADSGSIDKTHMILKQLQVEFPKLVILSDTEKDHGSKVIALYKYALQNGADYIFQTDSDGQTDPTEFKAFWQMRTYYDAVIGYRRIRGDGKFRAFVEHVVCRLLKFYFGVEVPDANAPFRLMNSVVVKKYINRMPNNYNLPNIMMTTYFSYYKENIIFKEITFRPRQGGRNSLNLRKIFVIGRKAMGDFKKFHNEMKRII